MPTQGQIETLALWMNAFIPGDVEGSEVVEAGPHAGKTMLPTPGPVPVCYLTDQRTFDSAVDAHSRMHSELEIDVVSRHVRRELHRCDPTIEINCETGEETCRETPDNSDMKFSELQVSDDGYTFTVELSASSKNACLKVANIKVSPNLDFSGTITITLLDEREIARVEFDGTIEIYPAFEMYVSVNGGEPEAVFTAHAMPRSTPTDLVGPPTRPIERHVEVAALS